MFLRRRIALIEEVLMRVDERSLSTAFDVARLKKTISLNTESAGIVSLQEIANLVVDGKPIVRKNLNKNKDK